MTLLLEVARVSLDKWRSGIQSAQETCVELTAAVEAAEKVESAAVSRCQECVGLLEDIARSHEWLHDKRKLFMAAEAIRELTEIPSEQKEG
jgi:hypothetical protein